MAQRFAHISDPHLSTLADIPLSQLRGKQWLSYLSWKRKRRHEHRIEVLDALRKDMAQFDLSQILISGDLTHLGLPQEFLQVRDWLEQLGSPDQVAVIPGNHDALVKTPWEQTFARWEEYLASDPAQASTNTWPSIRQRGELVFIGLSSACPTPPLMASGSIDPAQLELLPALLDRYRGSFRVVYVHHTPVAGVEKWRKSLRNAGALREVIAAAGAELVLHGHGHRARHDALPGRDGEVPVLAVPSASALGLHGKDGAAYNCYCAERDSSGWRLSIEHRYFDAASRAFQSRESESIALAR